MSLIQEVLYVVSNYPGGYRAIYDILYPDTPGKDNRKMENNLRSTLSQMKRKGLIKNTGDKWQISAEGKEYLSSKAKSPKNFSPIHKHLSSAKKEMIVIFDIPEKKRYYRDWLRNELIGLGYELVQKSVWLGPKLPKEFIEHLEEVEILQFVKFFRVSKEDII